MARLDVEVYLITDYLITADLKDLAVERPRTHVDIKPTGGA